MTTLAKYLLAAWVLASMLFAHGCHGNEDNELFTACVEWVTTLARSASEG